MISYSFPENNMRTFFVCDVASLLYKARLKPQQPVDIIYHIVQEKKSKKKKQRSCTSQYCILYNAQTTTTSHHKNITTLPAKKNKSIKQNPKAYNAYKEKTMKNTLTHQRLPPNIACHMIKEKLYSFIIFIYTIYTSYIAYIMYIYRHGTTKHKFSQRK